MTPSDYDRRYAEMSDGELAKLVSDGRDSLNELAREALDHELGKRGLSDERLAQEYPAEKKSPTQPTPPSVNQGLSPKDTLKGVKPWWLVVMGTSLVAVVTITVIRQRAANMNELYRTVVWGVDTTKSRAAFDELAKHQGQYANELVLRVATEKHELDFGGNQVAAIKALGKRGDSNTAERLADLLHPFEGLAVREAVADSLLLLPCSLPCIGSVLRYREAMWRGDPSPEGALPQSDSVAKELNQERLETDLKLDKVLSRERTATLMVLTRDYGLGELFSSPFALYMVVQLKLTEACPLLLRDIKAPPREQEIMPAMAKIREHIISSAEQLNCDRAPQP